MDEQPRLTDLVPTRLSVLAALFLFGLALVAGIAALYSWMPQLAPLTSDGRVAAMDLDGEGSLAVWFSSMTLAAAALVSLVVYPARYYPDAASLYPSRDKVIPRAVGYGEERARSVHPRYQKLE